MDTFVFGDYLFRYDLYDCMIYDGYLFYTFGDIMGNIFRTNWLLFLVWEHCMGFGKDMRSC
jgi:hypothetical protein